MRTLDSRLLGHARSARLGLAADVVLGLLATIAVLVQAIVFADIVSDAFDGRVPAEGTIVVLAIVVSARAIFAGGFEAIGRRAGARALSELRMALVRRRLVEAPLAADGVEAAEVAAAAVQGIDALETYFARYLPQLVLAVLVPPVVLAWSFSIDPTSAVIMLITLPLIPVFMVLIGRVTDARTRARWRALSRLSTHFLDVVRGLATLRAFNRAEAQAERIESASEEYRATTMQVLRVSFLSGAVLDLVATIATALVAVTLGIRLVDGDIAFRAAFTVLLVTPELYAPLRALSAQFHASADGLAAAERILDLLDSPTSAVEGTGPGDARRVGGDGPGDRVPIPLPWEALRLESVSFAYDGRAESLLSAADLVLRRGEIVLLAGPSGAGKSTVASLLLGILRPQAGSVTVDGIDLLRIGLGAWHRHLAWLPQHPTMFCGTVRENIAIGDRSASQGDVEHAARLAGAEGFIRDLRHGYDTVIGDGGRGLSAGEARRIALARALVRPASLLILDEPSANLDARTAAEVFDGIARVARDRAVLLIEHVPGRVRIADRVVRIDRGRFVASDGMAPGMAAISTVTVGGASANDAAEIRP